MSELVLHHYPLSPFAEKIRRLLGVKGLAWHSVEQPVIAPKPDLTPLTGGYRRIPVLQVGADVYCDTALIVRVLERLHPTPACLPAALAGAAALVEDWADHRLFMQTVPPTVVKLIDQLPPEFFADRAAMTPAFTRESLIATAPHALAQARVSLDNLDAQLQATPFVLGETFTVADAACFHPVWFMQHGGAELLAEIHSRPGLAAWFDRLNAFGSGRPSTLAAADALAMAREHAPADIAGGCAPDSGYAGGELVDIVPDDYGREVSRGTVVRANAAEIVILRSDPQVGEVAVHYPRAGYRVTVV